MIKKKYTLKNKKNTLKNKKKYTKKKGGRNCYKILNEIKNYIIKVFIKGDYDICCNLLKITLTYDNIAKYLNLQKFIANNIKDEDKRLYIELTINPTGDYHDKVPIPLIGGMGPLSDAALTVKLINKLKIKRKFILYSIPPPRSIKGVFDRARIYLNNINTIFKLHKQNNIYLLSNTAHLNLNKISKLNKKIKKKYNYYDLTKKVIETINNDKSNKNNPLIVLSTINSYDNKLYTSKFGDNEIILKKDEASLIQKAINDLKKNGRDTRNIINKIIIKKISKLPYGNKPIRLLLGCTELSLWKENNKKTINNYIIYDTEEIFVNSIIENINKRSKYM
jgi:aspartate/glutamate racemase